MSSHYEVYVQRYPDGGRLQQITTAGGLFPRWSGDGRELFKPSFAVLAPTAPYDVAPDGQRFVFVRDESRQPGPAQFNFVQGWLQELTRQVPAK